MTRHLALLALASLLITGCRAKDEDGDGFSVLDDCDDTNAAVSPSAVELCNGLDDDCDGVIDNSTATDATTWYADGDRDGFGADDLTQPACAQPIGFVDVGGDCNDIDASSYPSAPELDCADPVDHNCDGSAGYADIDKDGAPACEDCDDANADVFPGAPEACNGVDDDCDGATDEAGASGETRWYADADADTQGDPLSSLSACDAPTGYVSTATDCDDQDATAFVGGVEVCDQADNDCNGKVDDDATDATAWYLDGDLDGYGSAALTQRACAAPIGFVATNDDCDDLAPDVHPAADERCNGVDDDCDQAIDDDDTEVIDRPLWYLDLDLDGYGDATSGLDRCIQPQDRLADGQDCDDSSALISPSADELCNSVDDNCDGVVDESTAIDAPHWYVDADHDGFGVQSEGVPSCSPVPNLADNRADCDDTDAAIGTCFAPMDGTFGPVWQSRAGNGSIWGLQSYATVQYPLLVDLFTNASYNPRTNLWTPLPNPGVVSLAWSSPAPDSLGNIWAIRNGKVYMLDGGTLAWTTVLDFGGLDNNSVTESDENDVLYSYIASGELVRYNTITGKLDLVPTGLTTKDLNEARLAYDPLSRAVFFGASQQPELYRWDLNTDAITSVTRIPESMLNDAVCSDRAGHIYAAGDANGKTMWQYTVATDTWAPLPNLPVDHGMWGACAVSADGYLYVAPEAGGLYRLTLGQP